MPIKLIKIKDPNNEFDASDVTFEILDDVDLPEMLKQFGNFLKACGYQFQGSLGLVDE